MDQFALQHLIEILLRDPHQLLHLPPGPLKVLGGEYIEGDHPYPELYAPPQELLDL
jgi:hypothetical protein